MAENLRVKSSEFIDETIRVSFKFNEKEYFRHTMHLTHGLATCLEAIRKK